MALTDRAESILGDLQPELQEDTDNQQVVQAIANEIDRLDATVQSMRDKTFPAQADDTFKTLSMIESHLNLPVAPAGLTVAARRALVLSHLQKRDVGSGQAWEQVISQALGNTPWTYTEGPAPNQVTIHIPYGAGTLTAASVQQLARAATPAHIDLVAAFDQGFLVGISQIGIEPL